MNKTKLFVFILINDLDIIRIFLLVLIYSYIVGEVPSAHGTVRISSVKS